MALKEGLLRDLKAAAPRKRRPRSVRVPEDVDDAVKRIAAQTGAEYTQVLIKLIEVGLEAFKKR